MPLLSMGQLKKEAVAGRIGGISIDTSIYEQNQFGLESGILAQMEQFSRLDVEHLMLDIVLNEIERHLRDKAELQKAHVKNSLKPLGNYWGTGKETRDQAMELLFGEQASTDRIKDRLNDFAESSSATILKCAEYVDIERLVSSFLNESPPFGIKQSKKHEFPDALALLALETWAKKKNVFVIVVSKDNDWKKFCEKSDLICFVDDLSNALSIFQGGADEAARIFLDTLKSDAIKDVDSIFGQAVRSQADKIDAQVEANSYWYFESELIDIAATLASPVRDQMDEFEVVDYQNNSLTLKAEVAVDLYAQFNVSFEHWDGIDREYVSMGSATIEDTEPIDLEVIVSVFFNNGAVIIESIELLSRSVTFSFGEIEPDWMGENDEREDQ